MRPHITNSCGLAAHMPMRPHMRLHRPHFISLVLSKMSPEAQTMQMGHDVFGTIENKSGSAKQEYWTRRPRCRRKRVRERKKGKQEQTPSISPKTSQKAQNMKMGLDALGTTENESGSATHENGSRHPRYRRKRV
jgi:hypothetical protein